MPRNRAIIHLDQVATTGCLYLEFDCHRCPRYGRYAVSRLAERFGADVPLTLIRDALSADCPRPKGIEAQGSQMYQACGIRCPTLVGLGL
jgi:hypothetical protein